MWQAFKSRWWSRGPATRAGLQPLFQFAVTGGMNLAQRTSRTGGANVIKTPIRLLVFTRRVSSADGVRLASMHGHDASTAPGKVQDTATFELGAC